MIVWAAEAGAERAESAEAAVVEEAAAVVAPEAAVAAPDEPRAVACPAWSALAVWTALPVLTAWPTLTATQAFKSLSPQARGVQVRCQASQYRRQRRQQPNLSLRPQRQLNSQHQAPPVAVRRRKPMRHQTQQTRTAQIQRVFSKRADVQNERPPKPPPKPPPPKPPPPKGHLGDDTAVTRIATADDHQ